MIIAIAVLTLIVSGLCFTCWKHQSRPATTLFVAYIIVISALFFTMAMGHCSRQARSDVIQSFQEEVDLLAQACLDLMESDISSQDDWEYGIQNLLVKVRGDTNWNSQLKGRYVLSSGGQDVWGQDLIVYRRNERNKSWVVVESAGPDGDMGTREDNVSSIVQLPD